MLRSRRSNGALGLALGIALALALHGRSPVPGSGASSVAFACGFNTPQTMMANGKPALLYPVPVNTSPPTTGIFALTYPASQPIAFYEDLSRMPNPPPASSYQLRWTFGDGSAPLVAATPMHTFASPGQYDISVEYQDASSSGWVSFDSAQIQITGAALPNPPVARLSASATAIVANQSITFDATGSHALVGSHLTYLWNFNDATTATGPRVTHQFLPTGGNFVAPVALIVTDDRGARSMATVEVGVVNDPTQLPVAHLTASATNARAGQSVSFDASGSTPASAPPGDRIVQYAWSFGDGSPTTTTQQPTISHAFQQPGQYRVAVQAIDQLGVPAQATLNLTVATAQVGPLAPTSPSARASTSPWPLLGGGLLLLLLIVGGYFVIRAQRQQARREHLLQEAMRLRRAQRVPRAGVRPGDARWGEPRTGARAEHSSRRDPPGDGRQPRRHDGH